MKKKRYSEEQIIGVLKQQEAGMPVKELIRQVGITEQTFYRWKSKFGGMEVSDAKKLRALEEENRRLKTMVADLMLDNNILKDVNSKKLVKPAAKRKLVEHARQGYPISERRACRLFGLGPSTRYYKPHRKRDDGPLRSALNKYATDNQGWGYRGLMDWLSRDGFKDNHKRVYRIYTEEGLQLGKRKRRVKARYRGSKLEEPTGLNELWTMDFVSDQLSDGRVFRMLVVMDVYSRECLALEADTSIGGQRVARVLDRIKEQRGLPKVVGTDNGPEFRSRHMDQWAYEKGVKLHFIKQGTPTQNAWIESLNSQIRKRLLNVHWFMDLAEVRRLAEDWRTIYNTIQRHGSLNKMTPEQFAVQARLRSATPPYIRPELNNTNQPALLTL
ncbi:MAG: IS3 family transposase [Chthoniobacterales bacterium]